MLYLSNRMYARYTLSVLCWQMSLKRKQVRNELANRSISVCSVSKECEHLSNSLIKSFRKGATDEQYTHEHHIIYKSGSILKIMSQKKFNIEWRLNDYKRRGGDAVRSVSDKRSNPETDAILEFGWHPIQRIQIRQSTASLIPFSPTLSIFILVPISLSRRALRSLLHVNRSGRFGLGTFGNASEASWPLNALWFWVFSLPIN